MARYRDLLLRIHSRLIHLFTHAFPPVVNYEACTFHLFLHEECFFCPSDGRHEACTMGHMGYGLEQYGTWAIWAMGHMGYGLEQYGPWAIWAMGHMDYGPYGLWARTVWAMCLQLNMFMVHACFCYRLPLQKDIKWNTGMETMLSGCQKSQIRP